MAKRKKRATARRGRSTARRKAPARAKSARGKATKRTVARPTPKKRRVKAKPKAAGAKKRARKTMRPMKPKAPTAETVIVDVIEEPVPGVVTVTEFEATEIREASPDSEQLDES